MSNYSKKRMDSEYRMFKLYTINETKSYSGLGTNTILYTSLKYILPRLEQILYTEYNIFENIKELVGSGHVNNERHYYPNNVTIKGVPHSLLTNEFNLANTSITKAYGSQYNYYISSELSSVTNVTFERTSIIFNLQHIQTISF